MPIMQVTERYTFTIAYNARVARDLLAPRCMNQGMRRLRGFTLIELMIVVAIIAIIAAIAIPGLLQSQRASNERNASTSLKTILSAEADFRANDRDGNRINDFWTFNVAGLYTMTSVAAPGTADGPIKLIDLSIAAADADGTPTGLADDTPLTSYAIRGPKAGYWFNALVRDASVEPPDDDYTQDTGGTPPMGEVHHHNKFGFVAWPDTTSSGKFAFIINEGNTVFRRALTAAVRPSTAVPPGSLPSPFDVWPSEATFKAYWSKLD
jgi:prepilin-type N-terminal cleavage/methylation domain-containing protein